MFQRFKWYDVLWILALLVGFHFINKNYYLSKSPVQKGLPGNFKSKSQETKYKSQTPLALYQNTRDQRNQSIRNHLDDQLIPKKTFEENQESDLKLFDLSLLEDHEMAPLISPEFKKVIDGIIDQVEIELKQGEFGELEDESFTVAYLFLQSLKGYRRFLLYPHEGPDLHIKHQSNFSGRYNFKVGHISLGQSVLNEGESRFFVTLFHEYQHHLFHTLYGTPNQTDILRKYYNEASAYLFEFLLASYMPYQAYTPHRGRLPQLTKKWLKDGDVTRSLEIITNMLAPDDESKRLFYSFMRPVREGLVSKSDLIDGINPDFHPDEEWAIILEDRILNSQ